MQTSKLCLISLGRTFLVACPCQGSVATTCPDFSYRENTSLPPPLIPPPAGDTWYLRFLHIPLFEGAGGGNMLYIIICVHTIGLLGKAIFYKV